MPTVELITQQLQSTQKQLNELIRNEQDKTSKAVLSTLYLVNSLINQALSQICTLSSK